MELNTDIYEYDVLTMLETNFNYELISVLKEAKEAQGWTEWREESGNLGGRSSDGDYSDDYIRMVVYRRRKVPLTALGFESQAWDAFVKDHHAPDRMAAALQSSIGTGHPIDRWRDKLMTYIDSSASEDMREYVTDQLIQRLIDTFPLV